VVQRTGEEGAVPSFASAKVGICFQSDKKNGEKVGFFFLLYIKGTYYGAKEGAGWKKCSTFAR
jgi:hypothetical protein